MKQDAIYKERRAKMIEFLEQDPKGFNLTHWTGIEVDGNIVSFLDDEVEKWGLEMKDPRKGYFIHGEHTCGFTACAVGFMPVIFPEDIGWTEMGEIKFLDPKLGGDRWPEDVTKVWLGLTTEEFDRFFMPYTYRDEDVQSNITAAEVAQRMRDAE